MMVNIPEEGKLITVRSVGMDGEWDGSRVEIYEVRIQTRGPDPVKEKNMTEYLTALYSRKKKPVKSKR